LTAPSYMIAEKTSDMIKQEWKTNAWVSDTDNWATKSVLFLQLSHPAQATVSKWKCFSTSVIKYSSTMQTLSCGYKFVNTFHVHAPECAISPYWIYSQRQKGLFSCFFFSGVFVSHHYFDHFSYLYLLCGLQWTLCPFL
jgi:hypothetical protein